MSESSCEHGCRDLVERDGNQTCCSCGRVLEAGHLKSDPEFIDEKLAGTVFEHGFGLHSGKLGTAKTSQEATNAKLRRKIHDLAVEMGLNKVYEDTAFRTWSFLKDVDFTEGRKQKNIIAASLYIANRLLENRRLLVDFAEAAFIDIFELGKYYSQIMTKLRMFSLPNSSKSGKVPFDLSRISIIDPSLLIEKYCSKLNFEGKTREVAASAVKLVKRMKKDWITYGRRPSGLCGAAILLSARCHGFKRSTNQIMRTVKVCKETVQKRLNELQKLPISDMTLEEFELDWENEKFGEADPPCFHYEPSSETQIITPLDMGERSVSIKSEKMNESLSDVDDEEISEIVLTPEESALKRVVWNHLNSEWLEKEPIREKKRRIREEKQRLKKEQGQDLKDPPTKRSRTAIDNAADNPVDSLKRCQKLIPSVDVDALVAQFDAGAKPPISLLKSKKQPS